MPTLTREQVRDAIVGRLMSETVIVEVLKWEQSEVEYIADDICDDLELDE